MASENWMFSEEAASLYQKLQEMLGQGSTSLQAMNRIRKTLPPEYARDLFRMLELRTRAAIKFSRAESMFFNQTQLEQATGEIISSYKARRFDGLERVADLCCGIGGDAIGLAEKSKLQIVDSNPLNLEMARRNVEAYQRKCQPVQSYAEEFDVGSVDGFHIDPDRRLLAEWASGRTVQPDYFSPDVDQIRNLEKSNPNFCVKLAPASTPWDGDYEVEFIGHQRECKQQLIWSGKLANSQGVTVTVFSQSGSETESFHVPLNKLAPETDREIFASAVGKYIYDPHASLRASPVLNEFAKTHDLSWVDVNSRYLSSDKLLESRLAAAFEVEDLLKPDRKSIIRYLESRDACTPEIKKRDKRDEHFKILRRIRLKGSNSYTIILSNTTEGYRAIICRRIFTFPPEFSFPSFL